MNMSTQYVDIILFLRHMWLTCRYGHHMKRIRMGNIRVVHLGSTLNVR